MDAGRAQRSPADPDPPLRLLFNNSQRVPSPRKTRRSRLASKESNSSQISLASAGSASGASTEDLGVFLRTPERYACLSGPAESCNDLFMLIPLVHDTDRRMPPPMQAWGMAEEADAEDDDIMIRCGAAGAGGWQACGPSAAELTPPCRFQNSLPRNLLSPEGDAQDKAAEPQTPPQGSPEGRVRLRASASYHGSPSSHKPDSSSGVSGLFDFALPRKQYRISSSNRVQPITNQHPPPTSSSQMQPAI